MTSVESSPPLMMDKESFVTPLQHSSVEMHSAGTMLWSERLFNLGLLFNVLLDDI